MEKKKSSKEYIAKSAMELLSCNSYDKVSVTQITENCGISKRTFYNYFKDKNDLIVWVCEYYLEKYFDTAVEEQSFHGFLSYSVHIGTMYMDFLKNASTYTGQNNIIESLYEPMNEFYLRIIRNIYSDDVTKEIQKSVQFFVCGTLGFMQKVLVYGKNNSDEEIIRFFESCIPIALKKYLE